MNKKKIKAKPTAKEKRLSILVSELNAKLNHMEWENRGVTKDKEAAQRKCQLLEGQLRLVEGMERLGQNEIDWLRDTLRLVTVPKGREEQLRQNQTCRLTRS